MRYARGENECWRSREGKKREEKMSLFGVKRRRKLSGGSGRKNRRKWKLNEGQVKEIKRVELFIYSVLVKNGKRNKNRVGEGGEGNTAKLRGESGGKTGK